MVAWCPVPDGARLLGVQGELHVIGAEAAPTNQLSAYGFSGELIPIPDPDGSIDINTLWDNMVTKPVEPTTTAATSVVDFDFDTANTDPDTEPGKIDLNDLLGLLDPTKQIMSPHLEWMSFAKGNPISVGAATPDTYTPRSFKTFRSSRTLIAEGSSYAMLAVSSPNLDDDQTTESTEANSKAWAIYENIKNVMNDFWKMQTGLTEAGAESPYDTVTTILTELLSPKMINPVSSLLDPMQYTAFCVADWLIDIPDKSIPNVLDANAG